jgi:hypothetical protein
MDSLMALKKDVRLEQSMGMKKELKMEGLMEWRMVVTMVC